MQFSTVSNLLTWNASSSDALWKRQWAIAAAPIFALVAFVCFLALGLLTVFAQQQDRAFEDNSRQLVTSAVDGRVSNVRDMALDWGRWNAAYDNITHRWDESWLEENFNSPIADVVLIVRDGQVRYAWSAEGLLNSAEVVSAAVPKSTDTTTSQPLAAHTVFETSGALAFAATQPISAEDGHAPVRDTVVIVQLLDGAELIALGQNLGLEDLRLAQGDAQDVVSLDVGNAALVWHHERPGSASFSSLVLPALLLVLLAGACAWLVARAQVKRQIAMASAQEAAQESNRLKSQFLTTMSHELRTPLTAIIGYSEILEEDLEDAPEHAKPEDARRIRRAARHLLTLINEVLDFSKIESGHLEIINGPVNIEALLRDVEETVRPIGTRNGNRLEITVGGKIPMLETDYARLKQCLLNLATNACKFTKDGRVTIGASIETHSGAPMLEIVVADTGIGIKPEDQARLFQPFIQVDGTLTRSQDGTGLGLVITRKLAQAMGGDVSLASTAGVGSTFTLSIAAVPVLEATPAPNADLGLSVALGA